MKQTGDDRQTSSYHFDLEYTWNVFVGWCCQSSADVCRYYPWAGTPHPTSTKVLIGCVCVGGGGGGGGGGYYCCTVLFRTLIMNIFILVLATKQ